MVGDFDMGFSLSVVPDVACGSSGGDGGRIARRVIDDAGCVVVGGRHDMWIDALHVLPVRCSTSAAARPIGCRGAGLRRMES
jgi:hypothetical protein